MYLSDEGILTMRNAEELIAVLESDKAVTCGGKTATLVDVADRANQDTNRLCRRVSPPIVFTDELRNRRQQCGGLLAACLGLNERTISGRDCSVTLLGMEAARAFLSDHHLQGSNRLALVAFGLHWREEVVGVMTLGRHHRQIDNTVVLDRLCFRGGTRVRGGSGKLFKAATAWAKERRYDGVVTWSDNRWGGGNVYRALGFTLDREYGPDYSYVDSDGNRHSKQSQKKSAVGCPSGLTEHEWAKARGLARIYDAGKKRWIFPIAEPGQTVRGDLSKRCAEQHSAGAFRHSHIRGFFPSAKCGGKVYFASSYELRCLFLLEQDPSVIAFSRCQPFQATGGWRSPDIRVARADSVEIVEVKPASLLGATAVKSQIADSERHAQAIGVGFRVWTEHDSGLKSEKEIVAWAKQYLREVGLPAGRSDEEIRRANADKARRHYHAHKDEKKVADTCCNPESREDCLGTCSISPNMHARNLKANGGKYVCKKCSDHRAKPTLRRVPDELELQGKRKCKGACQEILPLDKEHFTADKSKPGGWSTKCKKCRAAEATAKYQAKKKAD